VSQPHAKALVIVESPTKAKTISRFLGPEYRVEASMGHIRDLPSSASEIPTQHRKKPWARIGVNVDDHFQPLYIVPPDKKSQVKELKDLLKEADELYIATDEDREGESIGWHLLEVLKPKVPTKRMVFHEITKDAIQHAITHPRELNMSLVRAQEARRILDRLVGYVVSPQLWKKIASKLSAGRVQSAAVKVLVDRERERMKFRQGEWWDLQTVLSTISTDASSSAGEPRSFPVSLVAVDDVTIVQSTHFNAHTGQVSPDHLDHTTLVDHARAFELNSYVHSEVRLFVSSLDRKQVTRKPSPPFITSTLQQEANRRLGWGAGLTMRVAQRLYESGYITYMRTDAPALAQEAVQGIRSAIQSQFGHDYISAKPIVYRAKSKGAQEAHEAIRPAGRDMKTAQQLGLSGQDERLYTLIWRRTMACQMSSVLFSYTTAKIELQSLTSDGGPKLTFRASGREVVHAGFMLVYALQEGEDVQLPSLTEGQELKVISVEPQQHLTKPPARFTEAALVKILEQEGVGRPSTYASIIDTVQKRGYVRANGRQLIPTFTAFAVTQLLENAFSSIVDPEFTASMEEWLDQITTGGDHLSLLTSFYNQQLMAGVSQSEGLDPKVICAVTGDHFPHYEVRVGRFGPFIEYQRGEEERGTLSLSADICPDEVTTAYIEDRLAQAASGEIPMGYHSTSGDPIFLREGRFGPYVQLGEGHKPKRVGLPKSLAINEVTLDHATFLLDLPRILGIHPEEGGDVTLNLGRYGAYVQHQGVSASLKNDQDLFTLTLDNALSLLRERSQSSTRGRGQKVLQEFGAHPDDGVEIKLLEGRYGPYLKYGKLNVSLPKGVEVNSLTPERVLELLQEGARKKSAKKKPTARKKTASKKKRSTKAKSKVKTKTTAKKKSKTKKATSAKTNTSATPSPL